MPALSTPISTIGEKDKVTLALAMNSTSTAAESLKGQSEIGQEAASHFSIGGDFGGIDFAIATQRDYGLHFSIFMTRRNLLILDP
jgi:hypothetical protein